MRPFKGLGSPSLDKAKELQNVGRLGVALFRLPRDETLAPWSSSKLSRPGE